jgi:YHS domain-containing protein
MGQPRPSGAPSGQLASTREPEPALGLDGFCPVTLRKGVWKKGDPEFGAIHRGKIYLFAGAEEQQQFMQRPDDVAPVLSGYDPVEFFDNGRIVEGKRQHGLDYEGHVYLFSSEQTLEKFSRSPRSYVINALQTMHHDPR